MGSPASRVPLKEPEGSREKVREPTARAVPLGSPGARRRLEPKAPVVPISTFSPAERCWAGAKVEPSVCSIAG